MVCLSGRYIIICQIDCVVVMQVLNYDLTVYELLTYYIGPQDVDQLGITWQSYISSNNINTLASLIPNLKSSFYIMGSIWLYFYNASLTCQLKFVTGRNHGSNVCQDAIIGVVSSFGPMAIVIILYIGYKIYKRCCALAHRCLSENAGDASVHPNSQEFNHDELVNDIVFICLLHLFLSSIFANLTQHTSLLFFLLCSAHPLTALTSECMVILFAFLVCSDILFVSLF